MVRDWIDATLRVLARAACRTYYRDVNVVGEERIPASGPIIFVGNHGNGLIDPALAMGFLPQVRFLAKATLWKHPFVSLFVRLAAAIPVQRRRDRGAEMRRNVDAFRAARIHLALGGRLCIFPEGMSHDEPGLQRMKTGSARIALETVMGRPDLGLAIVPFGLSFSARDRFRSRVGMVIGDPIPVTSAGGEGVDWGEVEALTAEIERGLTEVTLNYESWREHRLVRRAVDLFLRRGDNAEARLLTDRLPTHRLFHDAYRQLREQHPGATAKAARAVLEYDRLLGLVGLTDRQVLAPVPLGRLVSLTVRSVAYVLLALPLAAIGFVVHALPYVVGRYLPRIARRPLHQRASWSVMSGVFLIPTIWIALTLWAVRRWGWIGCLTVILAPLSGWVALRVAETLYRLWHSARNMASLQLRRRTHQRLLEARQRAQLAIADLVEIYTGPDRPPSDG